jgi:cation diffusion facilitator family transporter
MRSRAGLKAVVLSLGILGATAFIQVGIFLVVGSVALLADLIHNFGDAATAIPVGIAFWMRSFRAEKIAGLCVVLAIFVSACFALYATILRFIDPEPLSHLGALAAAGVIGFLGNEIAAQIRLRAGRRLASPALIADGNHARVDGFVSLGVVVSALGVALGFDLADPIVGLAITLVILKITWDSWHTVRKAEPGDLGAAHEH